MDSGDMERHITNGGLVRNGASMKKVDQAQKVSFKANTFKFDISKDDPQYEYLKNLV